MYACTWAWDVDMHVCMHMSTRMYVNMYVNIAYMWVCVHRADERGVRGHTSPGPGSVAGARGGALNCVKMKNVLKDKNKLLKKKKKLGHRKIWWTNQLF